MEQTAVDWQFEQLFNSFEKFNNGEYTFNVYLIKNLQIREQAKEMEREQIMDAFIDGDCNGTFETINAEQYYNETFNQKENTK